MFKILFSFLFCISFIGYSQNYKAVDSKVKNYPRFQNIDDLGIRIQNDYAIDSLRVRAAFIWLVSNMEYQKTLDDTFAPMPQVLYNSEYGKKVQIKKYNNEKAKKAFTKRQGICQDYSLILDYLLQKFGLQSHIVYGIAKTDIKDVSDKKLYKSHSWNAVNINGDWRLLDATWASGYWDSRAQRFVKSYIDHYFFTIPSQFVKHHFPADDNWQLLENPVNAIDFFKAPIFFPGYFENEIQLISEGDGMFHFQNTDHQVLSFGELPENGELYYKTNDSSILKRLTFKKEKDEIHSSKIRFRKYWKSSEYLTIYYENKPILGFKLEGHKK